MATGGAGATGVSYHRSSPSKNGRHENDSTSCRKKEICVFLLNQKALVIPLDANCDELVITAQEIKNRVKNELKRLFKKERQERYRESLIDGHKDDQDDEYGVKQEFESWHEFFSVWMVSQNFEVQLQSSHKPFQILKSWPQLLFKYAGVDGSSSSSSSSTEESCQESECPVLSYQRNVFLKKHEEQMVEDINTVNPL